MNATHEPTHATPASPVLTRDELARELKISVPTLDSWRTEGRLPEPAILVVDKAGRARTVRWSRSQIDAWLSAGCPQKSPRTPGRRSSRS